MSGSVLQYYFIIISIIDVWRLNRSHRLLNRSHRFKYIFIEVWSDSAILSTIDLTSLTPESYSLNIQVKNPQLPNYFHSSEGMDKFHRPEKNQNCEDRFNVRIEGTVPSCKMPRGHLFFVARE